MCSLLLVRLDLLLVVVGLLVATGRAEVVPLLQPGFFFDYNIQGQSPPIPLTQQCETIHLTWGRRNAIGPTPVAPYSMVVYTSTYTTPFTIDVGSGLSFDWQVPFAPGTQYQICMWDKNGVPGGCQDHYTVVQNTTVAQPTCANVTAPVALNVNPTIAGGPLGQYSFVDQCTDIFVQPLSGKPPFTLTAAPSLHPPFNITSNTMDPIAWTVSLSWSFPFFLSLASSDGQLWSFGPLHAGGFGPTDCLAPGTISQSKAHSVAVGAGFGGAFAAGILAGLAALLYIRRHRPPAQLDAFNTNAQFAPGSRPGSLVARGRSDSQTATDPLSWTTVSDRRSSQVGARGRTYVLHHDAGSAPVTVITESNSEVVELPPQYRSDNSEASTAARQAAREKPFPRLPPEAARPLPARSMSFNSDASSSSV